MTVLTAAMSKLNVGMTIKYQEHIQPPVQPRQVDLGVVTAMARRQISSVPESLAEEHDRDSTGADVVVVALAARVRDVARATENDQHR